MLHKVQESPSRHAGGKARSAGAGTNDTPIRTPSHHKTTPRTGTKKEKTTEKMKERGPAEPKAKTGAGVNKTSPKKATPRKKTAMVSKATPGKAAAKK